MPDAWAAWNCRQVVGPQARPCWAAGSLSTTPSATPAAARSRPGCYRPDRHGRTQHAPHRSIPTAALATGPRPARKPRRPRHQGPARPLRHWATKITPRATPGRATPVLHPLAADIDDQGDGGLVHSLGQPHLKRAAIVARAPVSRSSPSAGITKRVGISCRTRSADTTLRRARPPIPLRTMPTASPGCVPNVLGHDGLDHCA